jgi:hypothetical protein
MAGTDLVLVQPDPPDEKRRREMLALLTVSSAPSIAQNIEPTQQGNQVAGDLAGGNIDKRVTHVHAAFQLTGMTRLIQEFLLEQTNDQRLQSVISSLEHYMNTSTDDDVRGLEQKLSSAGRGSTLKTAIRRKHEATQFILKNQSSPAAQKIISFLLGKILTAFENQVSPLIEARAPQPQIDAAIEQHVLDSAWKFLETNPLDIDHKMLISLVYFLGGNCHLRWDPC